MWTGPNAEATPTMLQLVTKDNTLKISSVSDEMHERMYYHILPIYDLVLYTNQRHCASQHEIIPPGRELKTEAKTTNL